MGNISVWAHEIDWWKMVTSQITNNAFFTNFPKIRFFRAVNRNRENQRFLTTYRTYFWHYINPKVPIQTPWVARRSTWATDLLVRHTWTTTQHASNPRNIFFTHVDKFNKKINLFIQCFFLHLLSTMSRAIYKKQSTNTNQIGVYRSLTRIG